MAVLAQEILLSRIKAEFLAVHNPLLLAQGSTLDVLVALKPQGQALTKQMQASDAEKLPMNAVLPLIDQIKLLIYSESPLPYSLQENYLKYLQEKHTMGSLVSSGNMQVEFLIGTAGSLPPSEWIPAKSDRKVSEVPAIATQQGQHQQETTAQGTIGLQMERANPINIETALLLGAALLALFYGKRSAFSWLKHLAVQRSYKKYVKQCAQAAKLSLRKILPEKRQEILALSKTPIFFRYLSERIHLATKTNFTAGASVSLQQELTFLIGINPRIFAKPQMQSTRAAIAVLAQSRILQEAAGKAANPLEMGEVFTKIFELSRYHKEAKTMTGSFKSGKVLGRRLHKMIPNESIALTTWLLPTSEAKRMIRNFPRQRRQAIEKQLQRVQQISTEHFTHSWSSATKQFLNLSRQLMASPTQSEPRPIMAKVQNGKIPTLEL